MADSPWEHAGEARAALNSIVTDPDHGVVALSSPRIMSNLLKDLLPDAPREKNLLVAAAEAGLADTLREHVDQGMDPGTAIRLTASSFSQRSPISHDACTWVTKEIAKAMGITDAAPSGGPRPAAPNGGFPGGCAPNGGAPIGSAPIGGAPIGGAPIGRTPVGGAPVGGVPNGAVPADGRWYGTGNRGQAGLGQATPSPAGPATPSPAGPATPSPAGPSPAGPGPGAGYAGLPGYAPSPGQPFPQLPGQAYRPAPMPGYQLVPGQGSRPANTLAVVAFVLGLVQFVGWFIFLLPGLVAAVLAIVLGFVSMKQLNRTGERGRGLAISGVVLGFAGIAVVSLLIVIGVAAMNGTN